MAPRQKGRGSFCAQARRLTYSVGVAIVDIPGQHLPQGLRGGSEETLRLALQAASLGTWSFDPATGAMDWSVEMERIFGLEPGGFSGSFTAFAALIRPEDRERVRATLEAAVQHGHPCEIEFGVQRPGGE